MFGRTQFCILYFIIILININVAEWIDMPQFSNENKIYRISPIQHNQFYKFSRGDVENNYSNDLRNNSPTFIRPFKVMRTKDNKNTEIERGNFGLTSTMKTNLFPDEIVSTFIDINKKGVPMDTDTIAEDKLFNRYNTITSKNIISNIHTTQIPSSTTPDQRISQDKYINDTLKMDNGIFSYLPIDILKNVHHTLQSQPISFEGKLYFLKMFERVLMSEIESRLTTAMTSSRKSRSTDYYGHSYDDHDSHSVGFPSIEGALMAISFLTFAVYLVRLVMLLFRNINNPMTTTAATLFFGKRRRSAELDDDTARILSNMNTFTSDF